MAVKSILRLGDSRLRKKSRRVIDFDSSELRELVGDMIDTMTAANGAGLAAAQIGVPQRVMIFGFESNSRYPEAEPVPFTILVNPEFTIVGDDKIGGWEGCLSVPGMRGFVRRYARIRYRGFDPQGKSIEREADGFHARVFQHELDHLDGVLYPDILDDPLKFGFIEELEMSENL